MSVFAANALKISAMETRDGQSQFRGGNTGPSFRFVSLQSLGAQWRGAIVLRGFAL